MNYKSISQAPKFASAAEALEARGMNWGVQLESLTTASGRPAPAKAVVRSDTLDALGVVGDRYATCDNFAATSWIDRYADAGVKVYDAKQWRGGQRCAMYALVGDTQAEVQAGDAVALQLVLGWSHDGSSSISAALHVLRLVCSNGLVMAGDTSRIFSQRHTGKTDLTSEQIQGQVSRALDKFGETVSGYKALAARPASQADVSRYATQVLDLRDDAGVISTRGQNTLAGILSRYEHSSLIGRELLAAHENRETESRQHNTGLLDTILASYDGGRGQSIQGGGTWWNAYNAVTEYLSHDYGRSDAAREEGAIFGQPAVINHRALQSAFQMSGIA